MPYIAGVDESGKGDFFGPLVIAAAAISELERAILDDLNVRDSKLLTDNRALVVARELKKQIPHSLVVIMPEKYNSLYEKIGNLNKLLAWGHARAIENLLETTPCEKVTSDQFANKDVLLRALMEKGRGTEIVQMVRGEAEPAVAAASILARAEFLESLEKISKKWQMELPKGASSLVDKAGKRFVEKWGGEKLTEVAKVHFKNRKKIGDLLGRLL